MTKPVFCADCQQMMDHDATVDGNGDLNLTCPTCERVLKFPSGIDASQLDELVSEHESANDGQVVVAKVLADMGLE